MVFDEKYGYVTPEYLEKLQEWSKQSEEYFVNNPDIELPPLSLFVIGLDCITSL